MGKSLIIVESKTKTKTIGKIVGQDYVVSHSQGHVRDLPEDDMGVKIENDFEPTYAVLANKKAIIKSLKKLRGDADQLFLATDPDREGEAIAWHLAEILGGANIKRIQFNEITSSAVKEALKNPRDLDMNLVNAQQARRILDRLVGYKLSPILWKNLKQGLSAGRVQSVAVRLVVEREREIQGFNPVEYWTIDADLDTRESTAKSFTARLSKVNGDKAEIADESAARKLEEEINRQDFVISGIEKKKVSKRPPAPFITSTLQQEASRKFGFQARKTMSVAQNLYEGLDIGPDGTVGLITYMRTDSTRLANEAVFAIRGYIKSQFGDAFLPESPNFFANKGGNVQDAHEAIRPAYIDRTPDQLKEYLSKDQYNLYKIIWERAVACQMKPALLDVVGVDVKAGRFTFRATGSTVAFPGFMRVYQETSEEGENNQDGQGVLPELDEGMPLNLQKLDSQQHFTKPPARYTDATLIKTLEEKGIGRPSTYAPTLETIIERGYVIRQKRSLIPSDWGYIVNDLLIENFGDIVDYDFTARMEEHLDLVERGEIPWVSVLKEFYEKFEPELKTAVKNMKYKPRPTGRKCPNVIEEEPCDGELMIKLSRFGLFYGCSKWPKCKYTESMEPKNDKKGEEKSKGIQEPSEKEKPVETGENCPKCGAPIVIKKSHAGDSFLSCSAYPKCRWAKSLPMDINCPEPGCDGKIIARWSRKRKGLFYGCNRYPDCKFVLWSRPTGEKCEKCGSLMVENKRSTGKMSLCSNRDCGFTKTLEPGEDSAPPEDKE